jgi:hypothetical protein
MALVHRRLSDIDNDYINTIETAVHRYWSKSDEDLLFVE